MGENAFTIPMKILKRGKPIAWLTRFLLNHKHREWRQSGTMAIVHDVAKVTGKPSGRNTDHLAEDWIGQDLPIVRCANQNLIDLDRSFVS
jgi:hypothetical protein